MPADTKFAPQAPVTGREPLTAGPLVPLPSPQAPQPGPSYYDVSMLKPPTWGWEVAGYFFLGGLSAGAYLLARMAERFGGKHYRKVTRAGTWVAALAAAPCAPLLIIDLGDPSRFHHMLRVFKPHSPMNLGAWTLTGYSGAAFLALLREWARGRGEEERSLAGQLVDGAVVTVLDAAGVPLAVLLAGYTGVLLSTTSTPVWCRNPWLGALFSASAMSTGAAAVHLALEARGEADETTARSLGAVDTAAHAAEAATLGGYLSAAGSLAEPLLRGRPKTSLPFWAAVAGVAASEVLKRVPARGRSGRWTRLLASAAGLAGGLALRWAFVHAGPESANDPEAARINSRPSRHGNGR